MKSETVATKRSLPMQQSLALRVVMPAPSNGAGVASPVVVALARLLLEAAKAVVRREVADDQP